MVASVSLISCLKDQSINPVNLRGFCAIVFASVHTYYKPTLYILITNDLNMWEIQPCWSPKCWRNCKVSIEQQSRTNFRNVFKLIPIKDGDPFEQCHYRGRNMGICVPPVNKATEYRKARRPPNKRKWKWASPKWKQCYSQGVCTCRTDFYVDVLDRLRKDSFACVRTSRYLKFSIRKCSQPHRSARQ